METPRIGDTVHYRWKPSISEPSCAAAIVIRVDGEHPTLYVIAPDGGIPFYVEATYDYEGSYTDSDGDTNESISGFTPRTWHHKH